MAIQEVQENTSTPIERDASTGGTFSSRAYSEVSHEAPEKVDVIRQFNANLSQLEELQGRLSFMMHELKGLIVKKKY